MNKYQYSLLSLAVITACYTQTAAANLHDQCLLGVPQFSGEISQNDPTHLPIAIEADDATLNQTREAIYRGNVQVIQGNRQLNAEEIRLEQQNEQTRRAYLNGAFNYQDHLIQANGKNAQIELNSKQAHLEKAAYQFVGKQGRGTLENGDVNEQTRSLKNATYTTCLPNDNSWQLEASEMVQHIKEEYAELWHARFKVLGVPIFYMPYLQYPIGDRRRSGLLMPTQIGHSSNEGWVYQQPIYWNIASNMDATLTPTYYTRRGWQLSPEFRYLTQLGNGKFATEYMPKDRLETWRNRTKSRHLFFWQHNANILNNWHLSVDYTHVSDNRYFSDFNSFYGNSTDGYATQNFKLSHYKPNYNFAISGKKFQTFDEFGTKPYRVLPQFDFNYYQDDLVRNGDFRLFSQIAHFSNDSKSMPTAWRFHLEPSMNFPLANRYGSLNLETKLYGTYYLQRKGTTQDAEEMQRSVSRVLPQIKLDFKTTLEAQKTLFNGFTQVLEPRAQYLFRPYKDQQQIGSKRQSNLGLGYDSALLQQDYFSLFNDRRYSGLDRIASANQITLGATNRFFDQANGNEVFNLSAGQIYYLSPSKIDSISQNSTATRSSSWALESNWKFHPKWNWRGSYQYDTRLKESSLANISLQYQQSNEQLAQLNYRYASRNYINQNLSSNQYNQDIKQLGLVLGWSLTDRVSLMTSYYQDIALKKMVESQLGLTYSSCCWQATFYASRHLTSTPSGQLDSINHFYYDNRFGVNVDLYFGGNHTNGISKLLKRGMIPYTQSFNIN